MQKISFEQVSLGSDTFDALSDDATEQMIALFGKEQPYIIDYLVASFEEDLDDEQHEDLFYLGIRLWAAIRQIYPDIPTISESDILEAETANEQMLTYLADENEEGLENFAQILLEDYKQSDLLQYVVMVIEQPDENGRELDQETHGAFFITLKTLIDCLEKVLP